MDAIVTKTLRLAPALNDGENKGLNAFLLKTLIDNKPRFEIMHQGYHKWQSSYVD